MPRKHWDASCYMLLDLTLTEYEPEKVIGFLSGVKHVLEATEYPKAPSFLCNYCEYADYCKKGLDYMSLPSTARRDLSAVTKRVIWL